MDPAAVVAALDEKRQMHALLVAAVYEHDRMVVGRADGESKPVVAERPAVEVVRREAAVADHVLAAGLKRLSEAGRVDVVVAGEGKVAAARHGDADGIDVRHRQRAELRVGPRIAIHAAVANAPKAHVLDVNPVVAPQVHAPRRMLRIADEHANVFNPQAAALHRADTVPRPFAA